MAEDEELRRSLDLLREQAFGERVSPLLDRLLEIVGTGRDDLDEQQQRDVNEIGRLIYDVGAHLTMVDVVRQVREWTGEVPRRLALPITFPAPDLLQRFTRERVFPLSVEVTEALDVDADQEGRAAVHHLLGRLATASMNFVAAELTGHLRGAGIAEVDVTVTPYGDDST